MATTKSIRMGKRRKAILEFFHQQAPGAWVGIDLIALRSHGSYAYEDDAKRVCDGMVKAGILERDGKCYQLTEEWAEAPEVELGFPSAEEAANLLYGLIALGDKESQQGKFQVTLDYDNVQDVALVLDGDGNVLGESRDSFPETSIDEAGAVRQFLVAIRRAISNSNSEPVTPTKG